MLDPKLKNDQKIQKCNWRSLLGKFLGVLEQYSSFISNALHINTGHIFLQYHTAFDYLFETVYSKGENYPKVDSICKNYLITNLIGVFWRNIMKRVR